MSCKRYMALAVAALLLLAGLCSCQQPTADSSAGDSSAGDSSVVYKENAGQVAESLPVVSALEEEEQFTDRDTDTQYDASGSVAITLRDGGTAGGRGVTAKNDVVTITKAGTYVVSGTLSNGQLVVDATSSDKIQLVLDGVNITCATGAALYIKQADKVFVTLADGAQNTLAVTGTFVADGDNNVDGTVYSKDDLTFNGSGALTVNTAAGHGIVCKDSLAITGGSYTITASGHAIQSKDDARISDGTFVLTAGKDGIHVENAEDTTLGYLYIAGGRYTVTADGDGFSASHTLQVTGGTGSIVTGGGAGEAVSSGGDQMGGFGGWFGYGDSSSSDTDSVSTKGFKAESGLLLGGGTWTLDTADDGLHSNTDLTVSGGTLTIASGDDGIHADGVTVVQDGTITITQSYEGLEGNAVEITGGNISVVASDDGLNAAGGNDQSGFGGPWQDSFADSGSNSYIRITGGKLVVDAGGDGIDANHSLYVEGGETYVSGPTNGGNGALDYGSAAEVTGGIFVAVGTRDMAQGFSSASGQGALLVSSNSTLTGEVVLKNSAGETVFSWTPAKSYSSIVLSCPALQKGESYTLTAAGSSMELTLTDWIYGSSGGGMGGGPGGMQRPGGRW